MSINVSSIGTGPVFNPDPMKLFRTPGGVDDNDGQGSGTEELKDKEKENGSSFSSSSSSSSSNANRTDETSNESQTKTEENPSYMGRVWKWVKDNSILVIGAISTLGLAILAYGYKNGHFEFLSRNSENTQSSSKTETEKPAPTRVGMSKIGGMGQGGNTCYMAGVLQSLLSAPEFFENHIENGKGQPLKKKDGESDEQFAVRESLYGLHTLTRTGTTVSGSDMAKIRQVHQKAGWVQGERQEDAAEYCRFIFKALNVPQFSYSHAAYRDGDRQDMPASFGPTESNDMLPLSITRKGAQINDLLVQEYTEKNSTPLLCTLRLEGSELPQILPVQLKRFSGDGEKAASKVKDTVKFSDPLEIPLAFEANVSAFYNLNSVVVHTGDSLHKGHYYTYAKDASSGHDRWVKFNDGSVSNVSMKEMEEDVNKNGYLFFYNDTNLVFNNKTDRVELNPHHPNPPN